MAPVPTRACGSRLSLDRIAGAATSIDARFLRSPQARCAALSAWLGCELVLKDDSCNPLGSFKGRGAQVYVASRHDDTPLVCASAGNFGMALAHAGRRQGIVVTVFVSRHANPVKVDGISHFGAQVRVAGEDFDAAKHVARVFAAERGLHFVEDGRELAISEGAGTLGLELLDEHAALDAVVLPLGNGALLAGVGRWIKAHAPDVRMIGVVAAGAPAMRTALQRARSAFGGAAARQAHKTVDAQCAPVRPRCDTIADGIAVRVPVPESLLDLAPVVDEVLAVDDDALLRAMRELHARTGRIAEPSAVAGLAAIEADRSRFAARRIATVLTGRNLTRGQIATWLT